MPIPDGRGVAVAVAGTVVGVEVGCVVEGHSVGPVRPQFPAAIARSLMLTAKSSLISAGSSVIEQPGEEDPTAGLVLPNLLMTGVMSRILIDRSPFTSPPTRFEIPAFQLAGSESKIATVFSEGR